MSSLPPSSSSISLPHHRPVAPPQTHYFTSHPKLNPFAIIPAGPNALHEFSQPHNRASK